MNAERLYLTPTQSSSTQQYISYVLCGAAQRDSRKRSAALQEQLRFLMTLSQTAVSIFLTLIFHRIIKSFRLENTFNITSSHHQPDLPCPITKPCPSVLLPLSLKYLQGQGFKVYPGQTLSIPKHPLCEESFLMSSLNLSWCNLKLFPCILSHCHLEKRE